MQLRLIVQMALVITLTVASVLLPVDQVFAQNNAPSLAATITSQDPLKPSLRLKNTSNDACQVATTAQGTVAITKVMQNGKLLQPKAPDASSDDDLGYLLQSQLKTIKPGESLSIPLEIYELKSGPILRATTWSSDGGIFSSQYSIQPNQTASIGIELYLANHTH